MPPASRNEARAFRRRGDDPRLRTLREADTDPGSSSSPSVLPDPVPATGLRLVRPDRSERADPVQQQQAFDRRCEQIALKLARTARYEKRVDLYLTGGFTTHELTMATNLFPDLMPILNDEWEWIAVSLADNEVDRA
jgi:hypothetical protein